MIITSAIWQRSLNFLARDSESGPGLCVLFLSLSLSSECHLLLFANGLSEVTLPTRKTDARTNFNVLSTAHLLLPAGQYGDVGLTARFRELVVVCTRTDSFVDRRRRRRRRASERKKGCRERDTACISSTLLPMPTMRCSSNTETAGDASAAKTTERAREKNLWRRREE